MKSSSIATEEVVAGGTPNHHHDRFLPTSDYETVYVGEMNSGDVLLRRQKMISPNGVYSLEFRSDGQLILYKNVRYLWTADTKEHCTGDMFWDTCTAGGERLTLKGGYMVVTGKSYVEGGVTYDDLFWTAGVGSGHRLVLQNNGNLVIYSSNGATWATGTNR